MLVVFGALLVTLVLFVLEPIPIDISAISILIVLVVLEPWTAVSPERGLSGFANPATITVLSMFVSDPSFVVTETVDRPAYRRPKLPIAVDVAQAIGSEPFSFVLVVTVAASTSLMTPVGYQTNLMVYGRGGYDFTDFVRVGVPLQLLLAIVTSLGIAAVWGV